jgi:predicted phage terminase large subunit-like protein
MLDSSILKKIDNLPIEQKEELLAIVEQIEDAEGRRSAQTSYMDFVHRMWPQFINGRHHKIMAETFDRVIKGECKRVIINMPPRHTKSEFASFLLPAKYLGHYPDRKILQLSHNADLATGFGRRVRDLIDTRQFQEVFGKTKLKADQKAAGRWNTDAGGSYVSMGIGGRLAGIGADLLIIDDPHSEQEYIQAISGDPSAFDKAYEWYQTGPRQRLQPGAAIVVVMCMTGDTPVLMADGTEKPLAMIKRGDQVATYEDGKITTSTVNNHRSSGYDTVYTVQTQSGKIVRANERHPFLVERNGETEWVRLKNLKAGDSLVSLTDASARPEPRQSRGSVLPAKQGIATTAKTLMHRTDLSDIMESGKGRSANAVSQCIAESYVQSATKGSTCQSQHLNRTGQGALKTAMASAWLSIQRWLWSVITDVMSVGRSQMTATPALTGTGSSASTMTTIPERSGDCSVMTAISRSGTEKHPVICSRQPAISDFGKCKIESITYDGIEEVFDVEIDRTENFIANGLVSHNTRWHLRDLTGRLIKRMTAGDKVDQWEIIEFPALMPETDNPLWPEFWSYEELLATRNELTPQQWSAQYLQSPTAEEGALVKREWWKLWTQPEPPPCEFLILSLDSAHTIKTTSSYSAFTCWGVFYMEDDDGVNKANIILLDAHRARLEFPELKREALNWWKERQPDAFIVEAKASGLPLIQELRRMGIPIQDFTPTRGNDKIVRVNAISDLFASGIVWRPDTRWAEEVVEEFAAFPAGDHDDYVDSSTQALLRFRQGGFISLDSDEDDEPVLRRRYSPY